METIFYILGFPQTYGCLLARPVVFRNLDKAKQNQAEAAKIGLNVQIYRLSEGGVIDWNNPIQEKITPME